MGTICTAGLFGHNKSGKTTLGEALLFTAKAIDRMGDVSQGNTTLDYDEEEIRRGMSVNLSLGNLEWNRKRLYLVDTPGYMDFIGDQISGLAACDWVILNIAADAGVEIGTERSWEMVQKKRLPCLVFVNRTDVPQFDVTKLDVELQGLFGSRLVTVTYPVIEDGKATAIADLLDEEQRKKDVFHNVVQKSMETIVELDDALMEKYLGGQEIPLAELAGHLRRGILEGRIVPVLYGSSVSRTGIRELLDFIVRYMPSAEDMPPIAGKDANGADVLRERTAEAPLSGMIVKTIFDPFVGRLSYLRVFSGKLSSNSAFFNASRGSKERIGQLLRLQGKKQEPVAEALPGEIVAVAKLAESSTFETFSAPDSPVVFDRPAMPEGALSFSITPKIKGTEDKLGNAIGRILEEDPTVRVFRDNETGETIVSGMGDVHLDVVVARFKSKFGVEVAKGIPKIAYRETITGNADAEGKFKRQTGGHGQYGHCFLKIEPLARGTGFEFVDEIVGGSIPRQFIPSVEKGVKEAMTKGVLAGYPLMDLRVRLYDGSYHTVDSSDIAFQIAGSLGLQKAAAQARPILLEPVMNVEVKVPQEFVGDIIGSINAKRGRVLDMLVSGATQVIKAQVPLAEMSGYTSEIRSITSGKGAYTMTFSSYEEVPAHIAEKIIEARKREKEESKS